MDTETAADRIGEDNGRVTYLLWHNRGPEGEVDGKLIGVYSTLERVEGARLRAMTRPGFKDHPNGFIIDEYTIDEDNWPEGFGE